MNEFDTLVKAKTYIDKLANGINPLTDEEVAEDDVVNNVRLSRCFFYVSDVLRQVIEKGGLVTGKKRKRNAFAITDEELSKFVFSDVPVPITNIIERLNSLVDQSRVKKLSYKVLYNWLKEMGILENANGRYGNASVCPTETGLHLGLSIDKRYGSRGEYFVTLYNRNAQQFIIDHLQAII